MGGSLPKIKSAESANFGGFMTFIFSSQ